MTTRTFLKLLRKAMKNYSTTFKTDDEKWLEFAFDKLMEELKRLLKNEKIKQKSK